jgi:hypothetical protein
MLNPGFDSGPLFESFREIYRRQRYLVVPSLFDAEAAARLRARVQVAPFYVADRGRYQVGSEGADEALFSSLTRFAQALLDEPLGRIAHRWLRFAHGDYQLTHGDHHDGIAQGRHLELTLDFSAHETDQGESVFTDGRGASFIVPQLPLSLALVERRDSLYRYDRYLNHMIGDAEVWRLRLSLSFSR